MSDILPPILRPSNDSRPEKTEMELSLDRSWRTKGTAEALLKIAHNRIEAAERVIEAQSKRIQVLEDIASTDPLTGLMNRRGFERFFDAERARIRRGNSPGALIVLIDLDRFKPVNDVHGHVAGDACLKLVAETLLASIRITDGAARFGGDEFALLLSHTDPEAAQIRVTQLRDTLNEMNLSWQGAKLRFGASLGALPVSAHSEFTATYGGVDLVLQQDKKRRQAQR
jgi:diguanylate cyclase (GGDEF)-like protein